MNCLTAIHSVILYSRITGVVAGFKSWLTFRRYQRETRRVYHALFGVLLMLCALCASVAKSVQIEVSSPVPVVFQDATNIAGPWQDIAECQSVQLLADGTRYFRGKLRTAAVSIPIAPITDTSIVGVRAYNGPAFGDYREVCTFPRTNRLDIASLTVWPTNYLAFTTFTAAEESDFGAEQTTNITVRLSIRKL